MNFIIPLPPDIFTERGIKPEIRHGRPYVRYTPENRRPVQDDWFQFLSRDRYGWVTKIAGQSPGFVITRHPPPGLGLPDVCAELRPDNKIRARAAFVYKEDDDGAKYIFPAGKKRTVSWSHDHAEQYAHKPDKLEAHLRRHHDGHDRSGAHHHERKVKDSRAPSLAKRLDMHPLAVPLFEGASRVFFGIEGCLKADAILSQGEAVFSVPSVTLWDAEELPAFAEKYLTDKTVFIVPDADWFENDLVIAQAMLCRSFLRRLGIKTSVAAPPVKADAERDPDTGKLVHNGVDDYFGAGGTVDELVVIGRELPPEFDQVVQTWGGRPEAAARDAAVLESLALHAADDGTIRKSVSTIARIMGVNKMQVSRAIRSLLERPGIDSPHALWIVEGATVIRRGTWKGGYYDRSLDWEDKPLLRIAKESRAFQPERKRVGDLAPDEDVSQFVTRSISELRARIEQARAPSQEKAA